MVLSTIVRRNRFTALLVVFIFLALIFSFRTTKSQSIDDWRESFSYLAPLPGAEMVSTGTSIVVRGTSNRGEVLYDNLNIHVTGMDSGEHGGQLVLAEDGQSVVFYPHEPFVNGETVRVLLKQGWESYQYSFQTAAQPSGQLSDAQLLALEGIEPDVQITSENQVANDSAPYRTAPPNFPHIESVATGGGVGNGYIFLSPFDFATFGSNVAYLLMLDDNGEPVFYREFDGQAVIDFKRQPNGHLTYYDRAQRTFFALDERYQFVRTYDAGNGYPTNMHDLQLLNNGNFLLTIYDLQIMDMSKLVDGGQTDAQVLGCIVQELDPKGNVLFEWRSWDHFDLFDTTRDLTFKLIDYVHCNSIEQDYDGHLLLSSRNLDEITKINRQTGAIIWRMGGKQNQFTFVNNGEFSRQHDARRLANGHMTFYDNGVIHDPQRSRGLEVAVDEQQKRVTVVDEYRDLPDVYARFMGNVQRLPNENTVVGWGYSNSPAFTEFNHLGAEILQFNILSGEVSYRAFRFPWQGNPPWPPVVIAYADGNVVDLYFSWNGSTNHTGYMIFAAHESGGEWHVNNVLKAGFESHYQVTMPMEGLWKFWVVAIDQNYHPSVSSEAISLLIGGKPFYMPVIAAR